MRKVMADSCKKQIHSKLSDIDGNSDNEISPRRILESLTRQPKEVLCNSRTLYQQLLQAWDMSHLLK